MFCKTQNGRELLPIGVKILIEKDIPILQNRQEQVVPRAQSFVCVLEGFWQACTASFCDLNILSELREPVSHLRYDTLLSLQQIVFYSLRYRHANTNQFLLDGQKSLNQNLPASKTLHCESKNRLHWPKKQHTFHCIDLYLVQWF